ncbi:YbbR-like domain-containing protein [Spongiimicrobium sp. 3-5]|uniref:CdaR family protein n=1 Tax=Spongiimicrobium sp. 3-5 TaxID=3332596 RepID=UPI0039808F62
MIQRIKNGLSKRKVKIFLLFLVCSGFLWFLSNLSEPYTNRAQFKLRYINVPDSLLLSKASKQEIDVKLRASGFQFLWFGFDPKNVKVDLSVLEKKGSQYFISQDSYIKQIEKQLSSSMNLLEIDQDTLFFDFQKIYSKEVPITPNVEINMSQNYLLDGVLHVEPQKVTITGPKSEIDSITVVRTQPKVFSNLSSDFSETIGLELLESMENTSFSVRRVQVSGKVSRFSEKVIEVPVEVVNFPAGTEIKTFPNVVSILCKAKIDKLKDLSASDFQLIADYGSIKGNDVKTLMLELRRKPVDIQSAVLLEKQVEFILRREQ